MTAEQNVTEIEVTEEELRTLEFIIIRLQVQAKDLRYRGPAHEEIEILRGLLAKLEGEHK